MTGILKLFQSQKFIRALFYIALFCMVGAYIHLYLLHDLRSHVPDFLITTLILSLLYALIAFLFFHQTHQLHNQIKAWAPISVALIAAVLLLTLPPTLSTDVYRYWWDGFLLHLHLNPYTLVPSDVLLQHFQMGSLYPHLDWKNYYTPYPPIAQVIFLAAYKLYELAGIVGGKMLFALPTIISAVLLRRRLHPVLWWLFILNPLLLIESFYGAHIDAWATLFVVLSIVECKNHPVRSGLWLALGTLTKIYPIIFLPVLLANIFRRHGWKPTTAALLLYICLVIVWVYAFLKTLFPVLQYYLGSLQVNEFNAGLYHFFYTHITSAHATGLLFVGILIGASLLVALKTYTSRTLLSLFFVFLLLSSVLYPWYTILLVPLVFLAVQDKSPVMWIYALIGLQTLLLLTYVDQAAGNWLHRSLFEQILIILELAVPIGTLIIMWFKQPPDKSIQFSDVARIK